MTRYVSYLDKPYKNRVFCKLTNDCINKKCPYKLKQADFIKLEARNNKQRVDMGNYPDCQFWIEIIGSLPEKERLSSTLKWRSNFIN